MDQCFLLDQLKGILHLPVLRNRSKSSNLNQTKLNQLHFMISISTKSKTTAHWVPWDGLSNLDLVLASLS